MEIMKFVDIYSGKGCNGGVDGTQLSLGICTRSLSVLYVIMVLVFNFLEWREGQHKYDSIAITMEYLPELLHLNLAALLWIYSSLFINEFVVVD